MGKKSFFFFFTFMCSFLFFFVSAHVLSRKKAVLCWEARLHASKSGTAAMQRGVGAVAGIAEGGGGNCAIMMQNYHHRHRRRRHHHQQQGPLFSASFHVPSLSLLPPSIPRRQLTTLLSGTSTSSSSKFLFYSFDNSSCRLQFGGMFS
jgi:hypothetical protein